MVILWEEIHLKGNSVFPFSADLFGLFTLRLQFYFCGLMTLSLATRRRVMTRPGKAVLQMLARSEW